MPEDRATGRSAQRRPRTIARERLETRLDRAGDSACIVVVAPAGYGKTTLLRGWASRGDQDPAWVSLDGRHDDAALLIVSIVQALGPTSELEQLAMAPLVAPDPDFVNVVVPRLCDALAARAPLCIVLDDLHTVGSAQTLETISALAEGLPDGVRLAMASRSEPAIGLGRLRTSRAVLELGVEDIAMSLSEATRMLEALGPPLEPGKVELLHARTEGWPVGLYIAALRLDREDDGSEPVDGFAGDDRLVADYVREEFLTGAGQESRDFLIQASILDRLSGELCDAVLDRQGSAAELAALARTNMLLVPLDNHDREYRLHALLRETLQRELRLRGAETERRLHRRAADWFLAHGDDERAVDHAIASGDVDHAARLVWRHVAIYGSSGRVQTMRRWLASFSEEQLISSPELCLARGVVALTENDGPATRRWAAAALAGNAGGRTPEEGRSRVLETRAMILQAAAPQGDLGRIGDLLAGLYDEIGEDDPWLVLAVLADAVSRLALGDTVQSRALFEEGERIGSAVGPSMQAICLAHIAILSIHDRDPAVAREASEKALRVVAHFGLEGYQTSAIVFATAALVLAQGGASRRAAEVLEQARVLASSNALNAVLDAETDWAIARTLILLDEIPEARERLAMASRHAMLVPEADLLSSWLQDAWLAADAAAAERGRWPLTPAELRLLHLMTTHLSFPKIAEELYVSANTVKTQAQSIYRKFSVSSRAEAIAVARTAGLIGDGPPPALRAERQSPKAGDAVPGVGK